MRSLQLRIPPVVVVFAFAAAMAAVAYAVPAPLPVPERVPVAVGFAILGAMVALAGVQAFRRHKTTVNPMTPEKSATLVSTGIYRASRNPMYLGFLLALVGWAAYLANWASALLLPVFVVYMNRYQIQPEERALAEKFGSEFVSYSQAVRRWL